MNCKTKKLLLSHRNEYPLDYIVNKPVDYKNFSKFWSGRGNSGNKLFIAAVEQYLTKENISYDYYHCNMRIDEINEQYDMVILPTANIFGVHAIKRLEHYTLFAEKLKIPMYIIGAGIQCNDYDEIDFVVENTKEKVKNLCKAVYNSGGEFALRGYFTKEYLDKVISNTAVVTGCPSMYQNGRSLNIDINRLKNKESITLALNGYLKDKEQVLLKMLNKYPKSVFMDQSEFAGILYGDYDKNEIPVSYEILKVLEQKRIKLIYDVPVWLDYLKHNIDLSIGYRIHGNLAAVLAGVPSVVIPFDARTRELAEFYDIPIIPKNKKFDMNLDNIIEDLDYSKFNKSFSRKFDLFEEFMESHEISYDIANKCKWNEVINGERWRMPIVSENNKDVIKNNIRHYTDIKNKLRGLFNKKANIALYGAGYGCELVLLELERLKLKEKVAVLFDSDPEKEGSSFMGQKVIYANRDKLLAYDAIMITSPKYENEIYDFLVRGGG